MTGRCTYGDARGACVRNWMGGMYYFIVRCTWPHPRVASIRAWRALRYNEKYAAKLERRKAKELEKEQAKAKAATEEAKMRSTVKHNPFSVRTIVRFPARS